MALGLATSLGSAATLALHPSKLAPTGAAPLDAPWPADELDYCAAQPRWPPPAARYDAVFGLGAGLLADPTGGRTEVVGDEPRTRALGAYLAVATYGVAPVLGFAGGHTGGPGAPSEAASMAAFVASRAFVAAYGGLTTHDVGLPVLEQRSTTTEENVEEIGRLATQRGWRSVLLVTSHYHTARALLTARAAGLPADVASAEAIVDAALADPVLHRRFCAHYAAMPTLAAIARERALLGVLRLLYAPARDDVRNRSAALT